MATTEVPTVPEMIRDEVTIQRVNLLRFDSGLANDSIAILQKIEGDLLAILNSPDFTEMTAFQQNRVNDFLEVITNTIREGYSSLDTMQKDTLQEIATLQNEFALAAVNDQYNVKLLNNTFTQAQLAAIVSKTAVEGRPHGEWIRKQAGFLRKEFMREIGEGVVLGETVEQLVSRTRPIFQRTQRDMRALVRTSVQSIANEAQVKTWEDNEDVVEAIQQVSTLDNRTSAICIGYSAKIWLLPDYRPFGHDLPWNGGPPRHWNCRSVTVPVVRPFSQLQSRAKGDTKEQLVKENLPVGTRAAVIQEERILGPRGGVRKKRIGAQLPADITFDDFLKDRSTDFQDQLLGKGRAQLFRDGKLTLSELLDFRGNPLPLSELKRRAAKRD